MIESVLKIACDLCGISRYKPGVSGAAPTMPDRWRQTTNRGIQGPDYCLDGVEIICDTCHAKLADLKEQIRAGCADDKPEVPKEAAPAIDLINNPPAGAKDIEINIGSMANARIDGRDAYFENGGWRYEDTGEPVYAEKHSITSSLDGRDCYWDKDSNAWRWEHNHDILPIPKHLETLLPEFLDTNNEESSAARDQLAIDEKG